MIRNLIFPAGNICDQKTAVRAVIRKLNHSLLIPALLGLALILSATGCVSKRSEMGVQNQWRDASLPAFEKGHTTQSDVMRVLGPPSQVIGLREQTIFYYLREQSQTRAGFFMIYNETREQILYDRAIFFFDKTSVLTDFAYSQESIPFKK